MVFIGHLVIALIFIVGLYIGATYSSLCYELEEIKQFQKKIDLLLEQRYKLVQALSALVADPRLHEVIELHRLALSLKAQSELLQYMNAENRISFLYQQLVPSPTSPEMQELISQLQAREQQFSYYKERYNTGVENFNHRKKSIFALPVFKLYKNLDQEFVVWPASTEGLTSV